MDKCDLCGKPIELGKDEFWRIELSLWTAQMSIAGGSLEKEYLMCSRMCYEVMKPLLAKHYLKNEHRNVYTGIWFDPKDNIDKGQILNDARKNMLDAEIYQINRILLLVVVLVALVAIGVTAHSYPDVVGNVLLVVLVFFVLPGLIYWFGPHLVSWWYRLFR